MAELTAPMLPPASPQAREKRCTPLVSSQETLASIPAAARATEVAHLVMVSVRVAPGSDVAGDLEGALGLELPGANRFTRQGERYAVWVGPDEWLVLGPDGDDELVSVLTDAVGDRFAAVVDVSGQRTTIDLVGPHVRDLLAHGCAMDTHPSVAPTGTAATTLLALAGVTLLVLADGVDGADPAYRVLVRSSFAAYLADWLADASLEHRSDPTWQ